MGARAKKERRLVARHWLEELHDAVSTAEEVAGRLGLVGIKSLLSEAAAMVLDEILKKNFPERVGP